MLPALALLALAPLPFARHEIASDLRNGYQVIVTDLNRDGRPDLIALASGMPELVWFENPTWRRHVLVNGVERMINVAARDLDNDGVPELALAHGFANDARKSTGIVSILRHQGDPTRPWSRQEIDRIPTAHRLRWADLDGDGKPELVNAPLTGDRAVPPDYDDATPMVFYRPGEWKRETLASSLRGVVHGIFITQWLPDRPEEVLTASFNGLTAHRLRPTGVASIEISPGDPAPRPRGGSSDVTVGHLRRTRFLAAIEPWHGSQVVVYSGKLRTVIDTTLTDGHTILAADFNRDGQDEIVAGYRGGDRGVNLYRYDGKTWTRELLDRGMPAAACAAADLNADQRPDIVCIGQSTGTLVWYESLAGGTATSIR